MNLYTDNYNWLTPGDNPVQDGCLRGSLSKHSILADPQLFFLGFKQKNKSISNENYIKFLCLTIPLFFCFFLSPVTHFEEHLNLEEIKSLHFSVKPDGSSSCIAQSIKMSRHLKSIYLCTISTEMVIIHAEPDTICNRVTDLPFRVNGIIFQPVLLWHVYKQGFAEGGTFSSCNQVFQRHNDTTFRKIGKSVQRYFHFLTPFYLRFQIDVQKFVRLVL